MAQQNKGYYAARALKAAKRTERLRVAKSKGRHTKQEWRELKRFYDNRCLKCGRQEGDVSIEKDHVYQLYLGGCDCIGNLQPLCSLCNCSKGSQYWDLRWERQVAWGLLDD